MHHQHVGVGLADVVLNGQPLAQAHRRGPEAGMAEGEPGGGVEAVHEGAHQVAVGGGEVMHLGAVHVLHSRVRGETVDGPVQVHDHEMQTVALSPASGAQGRDGGEVDDIVFGGGEGGDLYVHPLREGVCVLGLRRRQPRHEGADAGRAQPARSRRRGLGHQAVEQAVLQPGGAAFGVQPILGR
jgi:hypothetical protein